MTTLLNCRRNDNSDSMKISESPVKSGKNKVKQVKKAFTDSSNFINFNKTIMAKHPNMEIDTAVVFKSMLHMIKELKTENDCREHLERLRWNGEPICPHCGSQRENHYKLKAKGVFRGLYKCKDCRKRFTVKVGTMFEDSHIPLLTWFMAMYLFSSHKKGISSLQLHRDLGVTQKTAWFMLSRMRNTLANKIDFKFEGEVQVDETFVGGLNLNRSRTKRVAKTQGRSVKTKTPVFGMLSQGLVYTEVVRNTRSGTLKPIIKSKVKEGTTVISDGWMGYRGLSKLYEHKIINHSKGVFKQGGYHTNSIEGFWSQLKRGIIGIYHVTSPKHLHKYCDEFSYRYNTRNMTDGERFNLSLINADERLMYKDLIAE